MKTSIPPLTAGEQFVVRVAGQDVVVQPESSCQRNWSRVGMGRIVSGDAPHGRVFLKQFLDSDGTVHRDQFQYEREGALAAAAVPQDGLAISRLMGESATHALLVYPALRVATPDELLRRNPHDFSTALPAVLAATTKFLQALPAAGAALPELKRKGRAWGSGSTALNFKGLDIRNIGIPLDDEGRPSGGKPVIFDFGRPYLAPIEEAAARLLVSCGLLNWGWPLRLFLAGPDPAVVAAALRAYSPFLDPVAVMARLEVEMQMRLAEAPHGINALVRFGKRAVIATVGRQHLWRLRQLLQQCLPPAVHSSRQALSR